MSPHQPLITLDLEGVLTPEIWIALAETTGIEAFLRTTRDEPDYGALMAGRLATLDQHGITFSQMTEVVAGLQPLPGAVEFLDELRTFAPVVILSDTYEQLAASLLAKLGHPLTLCHRMEIVDDRVIGVEVRTLHAKRKAVVAYQGLGYHVTAAGDSFNDIEMLTTADHGALFRPSQLVVDTHPEFTVLTEFDELLARLTNACAELQLQA